jgi:hypothetical protein
MLFSVSPTAIGKSSQRILEYLQALLSMEKLASIKRFDMVTKTGSGAPAVLRFAGRSTPA